MTIIFISLGILIVLAILDLIVGVSNDAANFLNSSIGSKVAPRNVIMIIASLGMLAGVTFSSGMMEVARKGIFHPEFFLMPELITIFLAVMLTDILLLDTFNTFGLPTSTTVSIVFELLGAAVAVSILKILAADHSLATLVNYINTGKALAIIMGILLSVVVAFFFGTLVQFFSRLIFTFDYKERMKKFGGLWGGLAMAVIAYFILIKGAKGASFLSPEQVVWIRTHSVIILVSLFIIFSIFFQLLIKFAKVNILKPVVLVGTFALAMAFAANDLVNFIGVPLAGLSAYGVASSFADPLNVSMAALQQKVATPTSLLLFAGVIMVVTLWISKKTRTVQQTEVSLARQDEGLERFGSSPIARIVVRAGYSIGESISKITPMPLRKMVNNRIDPDGFSPEKAADGQSQSFDLLRASVNLMVASAIVSWATSMKLPLSTTYVTFMVAMGSSFADQAWGRESAVYRITGVLTVIGGWFFTAICAFTVAFIFAGIIHYFGIFGIITLVFFSALIIANSYRLHHERSTESEAAKAFTFREVNDPDTAMKMVFEQTGQFLRRISDNLDVCIDSSFVEHRARLKNIKDQTSQLQGWADVITADIFKTLLLLSKQDLAGNQKYSGTIRSLNQISDSYNEIVLRLHKHLENYHKGFLEIQQEELGKVKAVLTRTLWNASRMMLLSKKVDYNYIANQTRIINELARELDKNQIVRIQNGQSKTRLSILFYSILENSRKILEETQNLLGIFENSFPEIKNSNSKNQPA